MLREDDPAGTVAAGTGKQAPVRIDRFRDDASSVQIPVPTHVLVIAGQPVVGQSFAAALDRRGYVTAVAGSIADGLHRIATRPPSLVILALPVPDAFGSDAVARVRGADAGLPIVLAGEDAQVTGPVEAFEIGAQEYVTLPLGDVADFLATVGVLLGTRRGDQHLRYLHTKAAPGSGWESVIGDSPAIRRVLDIFRQLSTRTMIGSTPTILLTGETGTGKGYLAKSFHYNGIRRNRPFVDVNCAAIPPALMESELFGHERGSFTDAKAARVGLFETAHGGTLFLDEIASLSLDLQAKLLTAIDEKTIRRIGGRQPIRVDVQIIAATHEDLARRVKDRTFREDLYHRLDVVAVTMPSLRDRGADVVQLAEAFLGTLCREYGMPVRQISDEARKWMLGYAWPGNVRELRNQIERIVLLENDWIVLPEHFRGAVETTGRFRVIDPTAGTSQGIRVALPPGGVPLAVLEREILREALARCEGNVSRAARFLSVSRQTLMYRMKKHQLAGTEGK